LGGKNNTASGYYSSASGSYTIASANYSHAEGNATTANGFISHAEGSSTIASGEQAHAEGNSTLASGNNSHAEGGFTTASGNYSHAGGSGTKAYGQYSYASGFYSIASGNTSFDHSYHAPSNSVSGATGDYSAILAGQNNHISINGISSAILAGTGNTILHARSIILGAYDMATDEVDTVYVRNLSVTGNMKLSTLLVTSDIQLTPYNHTIVIKANSSSVVCELPLITSASTNYEFDIVCINADNSVYVGGFKEEKLRIVSITNTTGNTFRYNFSGITLTGVTSGETAKITGCTDNNNNGYFTITSVDDTTKYIEITNTSGVVQTGSTGIVYSSDFYDYMIAYETRTYKSYYAQNMYLRIN